jgi:hypothetical protein
MKVLLAGLFHETHCFVPDTTGLGDFKVELGDAILARRGDGSQIDGFLEVADREGWEIVPACSYTATPSGRVEDAVVDAFVDLIPARRRSARASTQSTCRSTAPWSANRSTTSKAMSSAGSVRCPVWSRFRCSASSTSMPT